MLPPVRPVLFNLHICKWAAPPGGGGRGGAFISLSSLLNLVISGTRTLTSVTRRLIEIWTWIIHAPLMSLGSLLTTKSRRVDLDVWRAARVGLIAAEVRNAPPPNHHHHQYLCLPWNLCANGVKVCCVFSRLIYAFYFCAYGINNWSNHDICWAAYVTVSPVEINHIFHGPPWVAVIALQAAAQPI